MVQLTNDNMIVEFNIPIAEQRDFLIWWTSREVEPSYPKQSLIGMGFDVGIGKATFMVEFIHGGIDKFLADLQRVENDYHTRSSIRIETLDRREFPDL